MLKLNKLENSGNFQKWSVLKILKISWLSNSRNFLDVKMKQKARKNLEISRNYEALSQKFLEISGIILFHLIFKTFPEISGISAGKFRKFLELALTLISEISRKFQYVDI